ncbi:hypothetical protein [Methylobacterium marchantiae]|uniref:PepSY domain-containing protein n=1 Tax=Methylobacterium marchantiae TaxID=600331 RepID=A0ABW3WTW7_9HYPH|nr:hypothetical protein AIGOOFII_0833 [Methylobacterium marchantiae]
MFALKRDVVPAKMMEAYLAGTCGVPSNTKRKRDHWRSVVLTLGVLISFLSCKTVSAQSKDVDPFAYAPYSAIANPRIAAKWGADALPAINLLRKDAALKIARHADCNRVSTSELSESRSAKPDNWVIVVDCDNGRRFYVTKSEIDKDKSS